MIQSIWQSSVLNGFAGIPLSKILGVWFELPFESRALCPSVTKHQQRVTRASASPSGQGGDGVNSSRCIGQKFYCPVCKAFYGAY